MLSLLDIVKIALFFKCGYSAVTANSRMDKICQIEVDEVVSGAKEFETHNFMFR